MGIDPYEYPGRVGRSVGLAFRAFEAMHPIGAVVVEEENYGADAPRERVGVIEKAQLVGVLHDERNIRNAQHAPDREHDRHRHEGLARPAKNRGNRMRVGEQTVKKGNRSGLIGGQPNDLRRAAESDSRCAGLV